MGALDYHPPRPGLPRGLQPKEGLVLENRVANLGREILADLPPATIRRCHCPPSPASGPTLPPSGSDHPRPDLDQFIRNPDSMVLLRTEKRQSPRRSWPQAPAILRFPDLVESHAVKWPAARTITVLSRPAPTRSGLTSGHCPKHAAGSAPGDLAPGDDQAAGRSRPDPVVVAGW